MADSRWNVKRGLNRLFVVSAICWYIAAGFILWPKWNRVIDYAALAKQEGLAVSANPQVAPTGGDELDKLVAEIKAASAPPQSRGWKLLDGPTPPLRPVALTLKFLFAPPALYGLAVALLWALRGFQFEPGARR
jgi:hypothetical protein